MEIKPTLTNISQEPQENRLIGEKTSPSADTESGATAKQSDRFTLTETAANMVRLEEKLAAVPEVDHQRVQAIKQAIESGDYVIDTDALVDNLIQSDKEIG